MNEAHIIACETVTASGIVSPVPCLVYSICGIGLANADNIYGVHNGQSSSDKRKFRLTANKYSADFRLYACPIFFSKGLYIDFDTNGEEVTVQFLEVLLPKEG